MNAETQELVRIALEVRGNAYAPYSSYRVGAAVRTAEGELYSGVNVENASYGLTICAERCALFKAISHGRREFVAIAVATEDGGTPCGACRQVLAEFASEPFEIFCVAANGEIRKFLLSDLLPESFRLSNDLRSSGDSGKTKDSESSSE